MMRKNRPLRGIALLLALLLLMAGGMADATEEDATATNETFTFRNGITWDTTAEQMLESEGVDEADAIITQSGDFTSYTISGLVLDEKPVELAYTYHLGRLISAVYYCPMLDETLFTAWYDAVSLELGEATEFDTAAATEILIIAFYSGFQEDMITSIAGWLFEDGTRAYLLELFGSVYMFYFNEPVLMTIGTV